MRSRSIVLALVLLLLGAGAPHAQSLPPEDADLLQGYLPKEDLGVLDFLKAHPEADGRGIVVAILDTGVDLSHPALQTTSTGSVKILDLFDGTDNGYLPLPVSVTADAPPIRGLTGRSLTLPADLEGGTAVRLGILAGRQLYPDGLIDRRDRERRATRQRQREVWEGEMAGETGMHARAVRETFEAILEEQADPGDRFDVAAFRRGERWEVRIDTDADGDLAEETPLHLYREAQEVVRFPDPVNLSVALERIAPDGSELFLFFDEGGHGTHVAGIVGGFYGPDDPLNGLAPGVQLLAAKVGNGRFGGSTSHNSIMKAAQWAVEHGADVINLSFGGNSFFDDGREVTSTFFDELVERMGVIICSSAGNAGPALSTVGSPGSARRIFGWGAAISIKTQRTNYGTLDPRRDDLFHFTSRGPLLDGDPGVDFISPGAALSSLPTWGLVKEESWNGTSMASPQGAGFCALLLSASRQEGIPVTPPRLRRAMQMGARRLPGIPVIEQGEGIPQALPTLEALEQLEAAYPSRSLAGPTPHDLDAPEPIVRWRVTVHNATGSGSGYYNRDLRQRQPFRVDFQVRPDFPVDSLQADRADFLRIVKLVSEVPWMRAPLQESLHSGGATISVQIDPSKLSPGLNVGRVLARDVSHPEAGIEFALVATVILPQALDPLRPILGGDWELESGDRRSLFLRVPEGASLVRLRLRESRADPANAYQVALSEPDLVRPVEERMTTRKIDLAAGEEGSIELRVVPGGVLEAVAFSRWQDNRPGRLEWRIEFLGVEVRGERPLWIEPGRPGTGLVVGAPPWGADLRLSAKLDREEEPLAVTWEVRTDSLFPEPLNGIPAMLLEGRAFLAARDGEEVRIDLRTGPEFEDLLDDSFVRFYDNAGREVAARYLSRPLVTFRAPHRAVYRLLFSIWTRGSRTLDEPPVISPVVLRTSGPHDLGIYRDPVDGFRTGAEPLSRLPLVAGERRRLFVRGEDLPEGRRLRGSVKVTGAGGTLLARVPLRADTRSWIAPPPAEMLSENVAAALRRGRLLAGRNDVEPELRDQVLAELALCERLRIASPQPPEKEDGKKRKKKDEEELPPNELWDLRETTARLRARGTDVDRFEEALERLRESLPAVESEKPRTAADRRRKEAIVEQLTTELLLRKGDGPKAREHLEVARTLDPDVRRGKRTEALLLAREGDAEKARKRAERWLEDYPDDREVEEVLIRSLLELGWWDLAAFRLEAWPSQYPSATAELLDLWAEVERVRAESPLDQGRLPALLP